MKTGKYRVLYTCKKEFKMMYFKDMLDIYIFKDYKIYKY